MYKFYFKGWRSNNYVRNFLLLSCGTFLAQMVPIVFYPIISRLFAPENIGTLATINAITGVVATVATGKYETSILIIKSKEGAVNVIGLVVILSVFILSVLLVLFYLFSGFFSELLNEPYLASYFYIPFISAFAIIIYQTYNEWCVRNKYFKNLSFNKIVNSSSISVIETGIGVYKIFGGVGIIWGDLFGRLVSAFSCIWCAIKKDGQLIRHVSLNRMLLYAKRYVNFPKYVMPGQLLNILGGGMPIFMIGACFSQKEVGFFSMANLVIALPASVISLAMRDVFRQRANDDYVRNNNCKSIYIKTAIPLIAISLIGFFIFYMIAPSLFVMVLGEQWVEAGVYARILVPMIAISFVSEVMIAMFIIAERMRYLLYWQILYLVMTIIPLIVGAWLKDIYMLLTLFMICRSFVYMVSMIFSYYLATNRKCLIVSDRCDRKFLI